MLRCRSLGAITTSSWLVVKARTPTAGIFTEEVETSVRPPLVVDTVDNRIATGGRVSILSMEPVQGTQNVFTRLAEVNLRLRPKTLQENPAEAFYS